PPAACLQTLAYLLQRSVTEAVVADINWARWCSGLSMDVTHSLFADLQAEAAEGIAPSDGASQPEGGIGAALRGAGPDERRQLLETYLAALTAGKLGLAPANM